MDSGSADEESPLVEAVGAGTLPTRNHKRDVHILSIAFLLVFSACSAAQNLESTINTEENLGTTSLGILYLSFTLFSVVGSPMVKLLGSKVALVLGTSGYWLFIAANLKPAWYTMIPASLYLGYTASIIWVGQGTYLTSAARSHAKDLHLHEGTAIGCFNGEFWGIFASTQEGESFTGTTLLFSVFLGSMTMGTILMCFISNKDGKMESIEETSTLCSSSSLLKTAIAPLMDRQMLLIIPLLTYSGLQRAFVWAEFTKHVVAPALGVSGVGGAMAVFGMFDAICSLVAGRYTSGLFSITLTISGGALFQILVLSWLLLSSSFTGGTIALFFPLVMAALFGICYGVFNTQLNALIGILFTHETEAAFAQLKFWQSASTAVIFFVSPYITLQVMCILLVVALCIAMACFLYLTLHMEKALAIHS